MSLSLRSLSPRHRDGPACSRGPPVHGALINQPAARIGGAKPITVNRHVDLTNRKERDTYDVSWCNQNKSFIHIYIFSDFVAQFVYEVLNNKRCLQTALEEVRL